MPPLPGRRILPLLIAILTVAFVVSIRPAFQGAGGPAIQVGDTAPDFDLMADNGQTIRLKDFKGKFLVLNFWASWCPPCVEELPSLMRFQDRFASRGVVVLGVSVDEDRSAYEQFLRKAGVHLLTARDPEKKISRNYGTFKFPETYLIDRNGKVVEKIISNIDWMDPQMLDRVEQLLRG